MTCTGDREIGVVSGRLLNNPGELACMHPQHTIFKAAHREESELLL